MSGGKRLTLFGRCFSYLLYPILRGLSRTFRHFLWAGLLSGSFFVHSEIARVALASPRRRIRRRVGLGQLRRRVVGKVWYENLAVLRGLSSMPKFSGRQTVAVMTDRSQKSKRCYTKSYTGWRREEVLKYRKQRCFDENRLFLLPTGCNAVTALRALWGHYSDSVWRFVWFLEDFTPKAMTRPLSSRQRKKQK